LVYRQLDGSHAAIHTEFVFGQTFEHVVLRLGQLLLASDLRVGEPSNEDCKQSIFAYSEISPILAGSMNSLDEWAI
jgi:hypothetical protein